MKITEIKRQKKRRRRYNIYLNGKFSFAVSEETLFNKNLKIGKEVKEDLRDGILEEEEFVRAKKAAERLLLYRRRSVYELKDRLVRKDFSAKIVEKVIVKLIEQKLLSDDDFARFWIEGRTGSRPKGRILIRRELIKKGVEEEVIQKNLDMWYSVDKEKELARNLAGKEKEKGRTREKIYAYLLRRGFSGEAVSLALSSIGKDNKIEETI